MTTIEWTHSPGYRGETWNPVIGCRRVSEGCRNCYAEVQAQRIVVMEAAKGNYSPYADVIKHEQCSIAVIRDPLPLWNGRVELMHDRLEQPLRWAKPRKIFVNSMSDLFHEEIPFEYVAAVFGVMASTPRHIYQILTKRPERMRAFFEWVSDREQTGRSLFPHDPPSWRIGQMLTVELSKAAGLSGFRKGTKSTGYEDFDPRRQPWPLPNVWLGVSAEDQKTANERIPILLECPAVVRWVSAEPLLGPIDFVNLDLGNGMTLDALEGRYVDTANANFVEGHRLDWVVIGGESGPGARECEVRWIRKIVEQCQEAGVAAFVKQLGALPVALDRFDMSEEMFRNADANGWDENHGPVVLKLHRRKGGEPSEWPEDIRVREFPGVRYVG